MSNNTLDNLYRLLTENPDKVMDFLKNSAYKDCIDAFEIIVKHEIKTIRKIGNYLIVVVKIRKHEYSSVFSVDDAGKIFAHFEPSEVSLTKLLDRLTEKKIKELFNFDIYIWDADGEKIKEKTRIFLGRNLILQFSKIFKDENDLKKYLAIQIASEILNKVFPQLQAAEARAAFQRAFHIATSKSLLENIKSAMRLVNKEKNLRLIKRDAIFLGKIGLWSPPRIFEEFLDELSEHINNRVYNALRNIKNAKPIKIKEDDYTIKIVGIDWRELGYEDTQKDMNKTKRLFVWRQKIEAIWPGGNKKILEAPPSVVTIKKIELRTIPLVRGKGIIIAKVIIIEPTPKSGFIKALSEANLIALPTETQETLGWDIYSGEFGANIDIIKNAKIRVLIWHPHIDNELPSGYHGAKIIFGVYKKNDKESFNTLINQIRNIPRDLPRDTPIIIIGTKTGTQEEEVISKQEALTTIEKLRRIYPYKFEYIELDLTNKKQTSETFKKLVEESIATSI